MRRGKRRWRKRMRGSRWGKMKVKEEERKAGERERMGK